MRINHQEWDETLLERTTQRTSAWSPGARNPPSENDTELPSRNREIDNERKTRKQPMAIQIISEISTTTNRAGEFLTFLIFFCSSRSKNKMGKRRNFFNFHSLCYIFNLYFWECNYFSGEIFARRKVEVLFRADLANEGFIRLEN